MCSSFLFQINKKQRVKCEFGMDFQKSSCWRSKLRNDDIIFAYAKSENEYGLQSPGLKNGCGKLQFFALKLRVRIWRTGRHTPIRNSHVNGHLYLQPSSPLPRFNSHTNSVFLHSRKRTIPLGGRGHFLGVRVTFVTEL